MSIDKTNLDKIVELMDSEPDQQCVVEESFLEDLDLDASVLSELSGRKFKKAFDFKNADQKGIVLRSSVFVFSSKEN